MKLLSLAVLLLAAHASGAEPLTPVDKDGYRKLIQAHKGKVVVVNFWATWCLPCREELPQLAQMQRRLGAKGMQLVVISVDEPEEAQDARLLLEKLKVPPPAYLRRAKSADEFINFIDPRWSGAVPAVFLYDRAGRKTRSFIGESDMKALEAAITRLF